MPKLSRDTAPQVLATEAMEIRSGALGAHHVAFESFQEEARTDGLFDGLPDDRCQCPHWGYVVKGRVTFRFPDHEEVFEAGDAYYTPPGHVPVKHEPGSEIVQFSPAHELELTVAAMERNMKAMQTA